MHDLESQENQGFSRSVPQCSTEQTKRPVAMPPALFRFRPPADAAGTESGIANQSAETRLVSRDSLREAVFL